MKEMRSMQQTQKSDLTAANTRGEQPGAALALLPVIGIVLYVILDVIAQLLPPHYSALSQAESDLAVGPYGFVMTINFVVRGLLSLALVWVLSRAMSKSGLSRAGLVLLAVWGIGALVLAIFPTDLAGAKPTLHGVIHLFVALLAFICGAIGELLLALHFARDGRWRSLHTPALVIAILAIFMFVLLLLAAFPHAYGLVERTFIGLVLLWILVVALRLHSFLSK
jgi:hypothetical membrane protein